jgi:hypothetical protein
MKADSTDSQKSNISRWAATLSRPPNPRGQITVWVSGEEDPRLYSDLYPDEFAALFMMLKGGNVSVDENDEFTC